MDLAPDNGADFIRDALCRGPRPRPSPAWSVPARSTINRVLDRHDLLERNPAKRPRSSWRRFGYARPRDCYQIDATEVKLADGSAGGRLRRAGRLHPTCWSPATPRRPRPPTGAIAAIETAFDEYGAPAIVLSDNGAAFTSRLTKPGSDLAAFARTLLGDGVRPINSSPYHPQTCGKVERHHQTLQEVAAPPNHHPQTVDELQAAASTSTAAYRTQRS